MCNISGIIFSAKELSKEEVSGKKVLDVGSLDVNGSLRPILEAWGVSEYVGVDIEKGKGVDVVCDAEDLVEKFGEKSFDLVISTELLEHVRDWKKVIGNFKRVCKTGGIILVTTRSNGFPYHGYPFDFWRYEGEDMEEIFSDCEIMKIEEDCQDPGVFVKVKKPEKFSEKDLASHELHNIMTGKRSKQIEKGDSKNLYFLYLVSREKLFNFLLSIGRFILGKDRTACEKKGN